MKLSFGSLVGWALVTSLVTLLLFVGFCAIPGLKSSAEDDRGRRLEGGGPNPGNPQTK